MKQQLLLRYGVLYPSIADQLSEQGLTIEDPDRYERLRHAVNLLILGDILTPSRAVKSFSRLHKAITKHAGQL